VFCFCYGSRGWVAYEFGCESEEFFLRVFFDVGDYLVAGICGVCLGCVFDCAMYSCCAQGFKFVCVADDVADLGIVCAEDLGVVEGGSCEQCPVFRAV